MSEFVRLSHRIHCGCIYSEEGCMLTPCAGHKDREALQRGKRAEVVPIRKNPVTHFLAALNPFRRGGIVR